MDEGSDPEDEVETRIKSACLLFKEYPCCQQPSGGRNSWYG
jgi:hypothetical protein